MAFTMYNIPERSYPRFKFHRDRLISITQRLEILINAGKLAPCISQGPETLAGIKQCTQWLKEDVQVTISSDLKSHSTLLRQLQVYHDPKAQVQEMSVTKTSPFERLKSAQKFQPWFIVFHIQTISLQASAPLLSQIQLLSKDHLENILIHEEDSDCSFSLIELQNNNFDVKSIKLTARHKHAGQQIQYLLEDRISEVIENIADFVRKFSTRDSEDVATTIDRECSDQLQESFRSKPVMDDLNPEIALRQQETMETDGEPRKYTDAELDAEFHQQMYRFLSQKTKVIVCDQLSKKYGISASLINEFLNEGFFDYDTKYRAIIMKQRLPDWASMKGGRQGMMICYVCVTSQTTFFQETEDYIKKMLKHLQCLEKLNFEVYGQLRRMVPIPECVPKYPHLSKQLQKDLLCHADVVGCGTIYGKLGIHVKDAVTSDLKCDIREILNKHHYRYGYKIQKVHSFNRHADNRAFDDENGIKSGDLIQTRFIQEGVQNLNNESSIEGDQVGNQKFGTLGCFVGLRKKDSTEAMEVEGAAAGGVTSSEKAKLYGITCAHCVTGSDGTIRVREGQPNPGFKEFATTAYCLDNGYQIDIAALEIKKACELECESSISFNNRWQFDAGNASNDILDGMKVFKRGAVTGFTKGILISNNYMRYGEGVRDRIIKRGNTEGLNFDDSYTILIDDIQGEQPKESAFSHEDRIYEHKFSVKGDSGAVVFYWNPTDSGERVVLLSLLEGAIKIDEENEHFSYSCHLKSSLQELCRQNNCELVMPWDI